MTLPVAAQNISRQGLTMGTSGTHLFGQSDDDYSKAMLGVVIDCVPSVRVNAPQSSPSLPRGVATSSPTPPPQAEVQLTRLSLTGLVAFPTTVTTQLNTLCKWPSIISAGRPMDTNYCLYSGAVGALYQQASSLLLGTLPVPQQLSSQVDTTRPLSLISVGAPEITVRNNGMSKVQKLQLSTGRSTSYEYRSGVHIIRQLILRGLNPNTSDYEIAGSLSIKEATPLKHQLVSTLTLSYFDKMKNAWTSTPQAFQCTSFRAHIDDQLNVVD